MAPDVEVLELRLVVVTRVGDGRRVEQAQQFTEGLPLAVVGGGAGQDQGVGLRREELGEAIVLRPGVDELVRLVDDDGVPGDLHEVAAPAVGPQSVDRDDRPLVVGEGVAAGGDVVLDPLDTGRVQPHHRDREARPQLVLELLQDVLRRHDEDALAASAPDQFGQQQPDLEGLAEADRVRDQQPGAQGAQGGLGGLALVGEVVDEVGTDGGETLLGEGQRSLADQRVDEQARAAALRGVVRHELGVLGAQRGHPVEVLVSEEDRALIADQGRDAPYVEAGAVLGGLVDLYHQPVLVPGADLHPGGELRAVGRIARDVA